MKLFFPHAGWAQVRWDAKEGIDAEVELPVRGLAAMPGVTLFEGPEWTQLEVPRNCWSLDEWGAIQRHYDGFVATRSHMCERLWMPAEALFAHQEEAARFLVANRGGLCADQMGLGKTRTAIIAAETTARRHCSGKARVIIAPGYTREVWRRELLAVGAIETPDQLSAAVTRNPRDDRFDWSAPWWFIHYDIAHWWQGYMATRRPAAAILDEIHWIKNGRAKRSKAAGAIAGSALIRIGLTGTPLSNRPAELWWPLTVIDGRGTWGGPQQFRERYCGAIHDGYGLQDTGPTNIDELQARLESRYIRRTVEDAGVELPPLRRRSHLVEMTTREVSKHDQHLHVVGYQKLLEALMRGSAGRETLARITKMRKLVSRAKIDHTVQLCNDILESGDSVVVFTWEKRTAEKIAGGIDPCGEPPFVAHGDHSQASRDEIVRLFQAKGGALVATLGALREGVTLTEARHLVLHDLDWVPANVLQAEARIWRIGQENPVQITWMLAAGSIDEMLAQVLVAKGRVMQEVLGIDAAYAAFGQLQLADFTRDVSIESEIQRLVEGLRCRRLPSAAEESR